MNWQAVLAHVRRYPWWYVVALAWLVGILALPVVHLDPLAALRDSPPATTGVSAGPGAGDATSGTGTIGSSSPGFAGDAGRFGAGTDGALAAGATTTTAPSPLALVPPEVLDLIFDAIPQVVFPPLPPELATLAAAIAPIAATGCSGVGLASIVVAVVSQSTEGVPLERVLPYLTPVSAACASFPVARVHTVCAADKPFVIDLGGVTSTPPILGLGIDQLEAIETMMASTFGVSPPQLAAQLRTTLDCQVVSE